MSLAKTTRVWLVGAVVVGSAVAMAHVVSSPASPAPSANFVRHIRAAYARLPLAFEANRGQTDPQVRFLARGRGYTVFLTPTEAVLTLVDPRQAALAGGRDEAEVSAAGRLALASAPVLARSARPAAQESGTRRPRPKAGPSVVRLELIGASANAAVTGVDRLPGMANYFIGNDRTRWHRGIPMYQEVRYEAAYPGIDLRYYGHQGTLEYDFVVAPGADPRAIALKLTGGDHRRIDAHGDLVVETAAGEVRVHKPVVYQARAASSRGDGDERRTGGDARQNAQKSLEGRQEVEGRFVLQGTEEVAFDLGAYDRSQPLVIDPMLSYSTYLGGSDEEFGAGIGIDGAGNAYVTGSTSSTNFPTTAGVFQPSFQGAQDAFVAKVDSSCGLRYATYLGGSGFDIGGSIGVDGASNAYVVGYTTSTNFPTLDPLQSTNHGGFDVFVTALNSTASALRYSTYLGGSSDDFGNGIAVDSAGNTYVSGTTASTDFPTANAMQPDNNGGHDAFVLKITP